MEEFQVGDIVDYNQYTGRVLSIREAGYYFVALDSRPFPLFISDIAVDHEGNRVTEPGTWIEETNLKLNKETKVLKILRQCQTSRCVPTGNVS